MAAEFAKFVKNMLKCLDRVDSMYIFVFAVLKHGVGTVHGARALGKVNSAFWDWGIL